MTRVGRSRTIPLPSPGLTNPFVQGHTGTQIFSVPTTLPLFLGHWDSARATSCQFDGAPGARQDAGIRAELSPCQKNVRPRLGERCRLPRCRCFHQMRFISRGLWHTFRGIQGSEVAKAVFTHLDLRYYCLISQKQVGFLFNLPLLLNVAYMIHARKH